MIIEKKPTSPNKLAKMVKRTKKSVNDDIDFLKKLGFIRSEKQHDEEVVVMPDFSHKRFEIEVKF